MLDNDPQGTRVVYRLGHHPGGDLPSGWKIVQADDILAFWAQYEGEYPNPMVVGNCTFFVELEKL